MGPSRLVAQRARLAFMAETSLGVSSKKTCLGSGLARVVQFHSSLSFDSCWRAWGHIAAHCQLVSIVSHRAFAAVQSCCHLQMTKFNASSGIYTADNAQVQDLPLHPHLDFISYMFSGNFGNEKEAGKVALIDAEAGKCLTRRQLRSSIESLTQRMRHSLGVQQYDVVMMLLPNTLQFPIVFSAILRLGAVATMMNPHVSTPLDVEKQMVSSKAKFIFTTKDGLSKVGKNSRAPVVLVTDDQVLFPPQFTSSSNSSGGGSPNSNLVRIRQSDPAALLYSSGTTGVSKGVIISHGNLIAAMAATASIPDEMAPSDVILGLFPMSSMGGLVWLACGAIFGRSQVVFLPKYNTVKVLDSIDRYKITKIVCAPPVALDLLGSNISGYNLASFDTLICAAAPLSKETMEAVLSKFQHLKSFIQLYGMTESTTLASGGGGPLGSAGSCKPLVEAKVMNLETNKPLPPNQRGELWIRGPSIMQQYLNNPVATAETIDPDGWLRTGDLVYFDDHGYLYIVDRLKELIKYKGYQVAPAELEAVLLTHPDITDCGVVPFPDNATGEIPLAYVVRSPHKQLTAKEVMDYVASQVSPYKKVRKVVFVDKIPKSATGKILRKELKLQAVSRL